MTVEIRGYRPADDHPACRDLWVELVRAQRDLYGAADGAGDPGAGFEEYLTRLDLSGMWVAVDEGLVVGLTGLLVAGDTGEVDPLVVTGSRRRAGIGSALLERVEEESAGRGLARLVIRPTVRDLASLHCVHGAGFTAMDRVVVTRDLSDDTGRRDGIDLRGLTFRY